jgi:transcriptional regulator with PAS, ATPase and Fis domain
MIIYAEDAAPTGHAVEELQQGGKAHAVGEDLDLLGAFAQITVLALESAEGHRTIEQLNRDLQGKVEKISEQQRRILALQTQLRRQSVPHDDPAPEPPPDAPAVASGGMVGSGPVVQQLLHLVRKVAATDAVVLIRGESGTGKELLARLIHREAGDPEAPFIAVNLAAIPRELAESALFGHERGAFTGAHRQQLGKFELASNGTLFLDEIGDLRLDLQAKLLRAIQEGEIERVGGTKPIKTEFRLIAATNVDLEKAVKEGRFREDLFYRINVIPIKLPPLRERTDDVPQLAEFFLRRYNTRFRKHIQGITDSTMAVLKKYWWPGNIRELENLIERLVAVSDKDYISEEDLPLEFHFAQLEPLGTSTDSLFEDATNTFERNFILRALEKSGWNVTATSEYLGIPLSTLKYKMDKLDVRQIAKRLRGA